MGSPKPRAIKLLVTIVNYYSNAKVATLVQQLSEQVLPAHISLSVMCVDNSACSQEKSALSKLETLTPHKVRLRFSAHNLGYGCAINMGAKDQDFDFLCCLNPDVELTKHTLNELMLHCEQNTSEGIWGGLTIDTLGHPDGRHAWQEPTIKNTFAWATGLNRIFRSTSWHDNYQHSQYQPVSTYPVDSVSGCCLVISANAWKALGGFDSDFFLYSEEIDLCRRSRRLGFQPTVVSSATLRHAPHSAAVSIKRLPVIHAAKFLYARKHHGLGYNLVYRLCISLGAAVRASKSLVSGKLTATKAWGRLALTSLISYPSALKQPHLDVH